jgi:hypothetical protein
LKKVARKLLLLRAVLVATPQAQRSKALSFACLRLALADEQDMRGPVDEIWVAGVAALQQFEI